MNFAALQQIVASGASARGASLLCRPAFWEKALSLVTEASRVTIVTGFYIPKANAPETDGPPGAVVLGRALAWLGKSAVLLTDSRNYGCLAACSDSIGGPLAVCADDPEKIGMDTDLLIFVERPGHAADGRYYNMKGADISDSVAPLDRAAERAMSRGIPVLGIGDGGNEAGMGSLYDSLVELMPHYARCVSRVPATLCLPVDVSNWGAYGLAAIVSIFYRRWVGLDEGEEGVMLKALLAAGAVDGVGGLPDIAVDGFALDALDETTRRIKDWYFGSFNV